jgi:predicted transcriptional regulator
MSSNNEQTFIITIEKSEDEDVKNIEIESLLKSLVERGSFLKIKEIIKTGSKK